MTSLNRFLLALVAAGLLAAAAGAVMRYLDPASNIGHALVEDGIGFAQLTGLFLLVRNGTLLHSRFFQAICFCYGFLLIGLLFKIMHWALADVLLYFPLASTVVLYSAHFVRKFHKELLDTLKLLWVLTIYGVSAGSLLHWLPREAAYLPQALLWLCLLAFVRQHSHQPA